MAKDLIRYFTKDDINMGNKHVERSLTSLVIRETQKAAIKCNKMQQHTYPNNLSNSPAIADMDK